MFGAASCQGPAVACEELYDQETCNGEYFALSAKRVDPETPQNAAITHMEITISKQSEDKDKLLRIVNGESIDLDFNKNLIEIGLYQQRCTDGLLERRVNIKCEPNSLGTCLQRTESTFNLDWTASGPDDPSALSQNRPIELRLVVGGFHGKPQEIERSYYPKTANKSFTLDLGMLAADFIRNFGTMTDTVDLIQLGSLVANQKDIYGVAHVRHNGYAKISIIKWTYDNAAWSPVQALAADKEDADKQPQAQLAISQTVVGAILVPLGVSTNAYAYDILNEPAKTLSTQMPITNTIMTNVILAPSVSGSGFPAGAFLQWDSTAQTVSLYNNGRPPASATSAAADKVPNVTSLYAAQMLVKGAKAPVIVAYTRTTNRFVAYDYFGATNQISKDDTLTNLLNGKIQQPTASMSPRQLGPMTFANVIGGESDDLIFVENRTIQVIDMDSQTEQNCIANGFTIADSLDINVSNLMIGNLDNDQKPDIIAVGEATKTNVPIRVWFTHP